MKKVSKNLVHTLLLMFAVCLFCFSIWLLSLTVEGVDFSSDEHLTTNQEASFAALSSTFSSKIKVSVPVLSSVVYDGLPHSANVPSSDLYTVVSNSAATNAGIYFVTLSLVDFANYEWDVADPSSREVSVSFVINSREIERPSARVTLTYNFASQSVVEQSPFYTLNGTSQAVDVGSYQVDITLNSNCVWDDGTNEVHTINWSIMRIKVDIPAAPASVVYNKSPQTAAIAQSPYYTVVGGTHTSAGEYSVLVLLNDTSIYCWSNGSTVFLNYVWKIERAVVELPPALESSVYNGRFQTADIEENPFYTIQNSVQKHAGNHVVTVSLIDTANCVWSDGTVEKVELVWTIESNNTVAIIVLVLSLLLIAATVATIGYVVFKSLASQLRRGR